MDILIISASLLCLIVTIILSKKITKKSSEVKTMVDTYNDRLNLLSLENAKLRQENDDLKERLRNVGFKDVDL